jgi:hypothetical protein
MKARIARLAAVAAPVLLLLAACESTPTSTGGAEPTMATIRSGGANMFAKMGTVSIVEIDGVKQA